MVTTFSEIEKIVLVLNARLGRAEAEHYMRFTFTHPMHSHPYNPELVTGSGIATGTTGAAWTNPGSGAGVGGVGTGQDNTGTNGAAGSVTLTLA